MALNANRLRRALSLSSSFLTSHRHLPTRTAAAATTSLSSLLQNHHSPASPTPYSCRRFFHSTHFSLSSSKSFNDVDKIDPDTILFEGCDYKHWLIVMDFGKDPQQRPSPEEMVETYVQTLAKVVGSVEEAKKRMYACSTTTYTGFQAEIDEETSQKFEGMPGVIFVLPDSYIDPVNKEYGGDKYINGTIIPRPPPVQYGRVRRGRQNDQRPMANEERQNIPPNYGPTAQRERSNVMSNRRNYYEGGRDGYQGGGSGNPYAPPHQGGGSTYAPPHQGGGNTYAPPHQGGGNTYAPPHQGGGGNTYASHQGGGNTYAPPYQGGGGNTYAPPHQVGNTYAPPHQGGGNTYAPPHQGGGNTYAPPYQGGGNTYVPPHQGNYNHGYTHQQQMGSYRPQGQMEYPSDGRNYAPPSPAREADGQTGAGSFEQSGARRYGQGPSGTYGQ